MRDTEFLPISIIMPAYGAKDTIVQAVESVCAQTHPHWELIIVADDDVDYEQILGQAGIVDQRIRHLSTGHIGSGSPPARNIGLDASLFRYAAILDADDLFHPRKLELVSPHLHTHGIVSCGLQVCRADLTPLRTVGTQMTGPLSASAYKFTNVSMDSMLVHDRQISDPRYDPSFPCLTDIEFLLKLFAANEGVFHLGEPLHLYTKQMGSVSNKPGASAHMVDTKKRLLSALRRGEYPLADPEGVAGMIAFYEISLNAEQDYSAQLQKDPNLLFEDHLEKLLPPSL